MTSYNKSSSWLFWFETCRFKSNSVINKLSNDCLLVA